MLSNARTLGWDLGQCDICRYALIQGCVCDSPTMSVLTTGDENFPVVSNLSKVISKTMYILSLIKEKKS